MSYQNPLRRNFKRDFFSALPAEPGVYFMRSRAGEVLYVGRAKNLRARLITYRHAHPGNVGANIVSLLERVRAIDFEVLESEAHAVVREREVLRAVVPPFNVADAWPEDYLFIGLKGPVRGELRFTLTDDESQAAHCELHGCYPHRRLVKNTYQALLRLLYVCADERERFAFPAALCRPSPLYEFALNLPNARRWRNLVSNFLHGRDTDLLAAFVQTLLHKNSLPAYMRPGLQRDIDTLAKFAAVCPLNPEGQYLSQRGLRERIQNSVAA